MTFSFIFLINSILLGAALAMDAFSVSVANALHDPFMKRSKRFIIAGTFGGFQVLMPVMGWICVHTIVNIFRVFEKAIPWIALFILGFLGAKMIIDSVRSMKKPNEGNFSPALSAASLLIQGIATSIDALSVGFTISDQTIVPALIESFIIGTVTFGICMFGLILGNKIGKKLEDKAGIFGGIILICIGIEIFLKGII